MPKPDPASLITCPTCLRQQPAHAMGRYPDGRDYCLRFEGKGALCWKERTVERAGIEAIVLAARTTKGTTHVHS